MLFDDSDASLLTVGADGLLKAWDMRTQTCIATQDSHEDKIWALDRIPASDQSAALIATGSTNGRFKIYIDTTLATTQHKLDEESKKLEAEQEIQNFIRNGEYGRATSCALKMGWSRNLATVLKSCLDEKSTVLSDVVFSAQVDSVLLKSRGEELDRLLEYVKNWNTTARNELIAQQTLHLLLSQKDSLYLMELPKAKEVCLFPISFPSSSLTR